MDFSQTKKYISAICKLIEHITKAELTKYGYKVVMNYLNESPEPDHSAKARYAITKYIMKKIPELDEIKQKNKSGRQLDEVDHLILKMEYEADRLNQLS
jgi:hypothetical protein